MSLALRVLSLINLRRAGKTFTVTSNTIMVSAAASPPSIAVSIDGTAQEGQT
jgi:hypothetical protein